MGNFKDRKHKKYGRLLALECNGVGQNGSATWICVCECGKEVVVRGDLLQCGKVKSCGCSRIRHGHTVGGKESPTYISWHAMLQRVENTKHDSHDYYKNVKICEEWHVFDNFVRDMGLRPEGTTIDRIDPFGNYEKGNCRWAPPDLQRVNRREEEDPPF